MLNKKTVLALGFLFSLLLIIGVGSSVITSIWTSDNGCNTQDENHYDIGDHVFINGEGSSLNGDETWTITGTPGSCDPDQIVASGTISGIDNGGFCFDAYTVQNGDCGVYKVDVENKIVMLLVQTMMKMGIMLKGEIVEP